MIWSPTFPPLLRVWQGAACALGPPSVTSPTMMMSKGSMTKISVNLCSSSRDASTFLPFSCCISLNDQRLECPTGCVDAVAWACDHYKKLQGACVESSFFGLKSIRGPLLKS